MAGSVNVRILRQRVEALLKEAIESFDEHVQVIIWYTYFELIHWCYSHKDRRKTFIATLACHEKRLVRVQSPYSGSSGLCSSSKMSSEVSTMRFLTEHSTIPVPQVYGYDDDTDGKVGGAWMVMQHVEGINVENVWPNLSAEQREKLALSMADLWSELMLQTFDLIGSLHQQADGQFFVGPMCFLPSSNHYAVAPPDADKSGPFSTIRKWLEATARQDLAYRLSLPSPPSQQVASARMLAILDLIGQSRELEACIEWKASSLSMEHVDFSMHNILLSTADPTEIVTVLDWEGARIVPMWAMNPAFRWPHQSDELENRHLRALMRDRIASKVPGWASAIGEECRALRYLCYRATLSDRDPKIIDPDGSLLFMSHDM